MFYKRLNPTLIAGSVFFLFLPFFIYRYNWIGLPGATQFGFMAQRETVKTEWEFFVKSLSLNRALNIEPPDRLLFRPGSNGTTALLDIFFRENLWVIGLLSLAWHGIVTASLFYILSYLVGLGWAALLATFLAIQYQGMAMVIWRHISVYLLALVWLLWGIRNYEAWRVKPTVKGYRWALFCFSLATLFHEIIVVLLIGAVGVSLWVTPAPKRLKAPNVRIFLFPVLFYLALSFFSLVWYHPSISVSGGSFDGASLLESLWKSSIWFIYPLFIPEAIRFGFVDLWVPMAQVDANLISKGGWPLFCLVVGLVGSAVWIAHCHRKKELSATHLIGLWGVAMCLTTLLGVAWGRRTLHASYLHYCSYYFYFMAVGLVLALVPLVHWSRTRAGWIPKGVGVVICVGLLSLTVQNARLLDIHIADSSLHELKASEYETMASELLSLSKDIRAKEGYCYAGYFGSEVRERLVQPLRVLLEPLLWRESCEARPGVPLYLVGGDRPWRWAELPDASLRTVPLVVTKPFAEHDGWISSETLSIGEGEGVEGLKTSHPVTADWIEVSIRNAKRGGVFVEGENEKYLFAFENGVYIPQVIVNEKKKKFMRRAVLESWIGKHERRKRNIERVDLRVVKTHEGLLVLSGFRILDEILGDLDLSGRLGIFHIESWDKENPQLFSHPRVAVAPVILRERPL